MQIILPVDISYNNWATQLIYDLNEFQVPIPTDVEHWRDWACFLIEFNNFTQAPLPDKRTYPFDESWREWASFFVQFAENL